MQCRGIRGATTVKENSKESILTASKELLEQIIGKNKVDIDDIAMVWFTTTVDLDAEFPAVAGRELGWSKVAMLCSHEMSVPGSLARCIRVLMLVNTDKTSDELVHIYLHEAEELRPDLH